MALAGQWTSPYLWAFALGTFLMGGYALLGVLDPELASERFRPPEQGADAKALVWIRLSPVAALLLAPLDAGRLHWSPPVPPAIQIAALAGFFAGFWFTLHAMSANKFFSSVIRIQSERGHHVVDSGPYRVIRHPGYLGMLLTMTMLPLALGSWWALVPAAIYDALILRRIRQEDQFLQDRLPGYSAYAARVTHRIVPGIW